MSLLISEVEPKSFYLTYLNTFAGIYRSMTKNNKEQNLKVSQPRFELTTYQLKSKLLNH